MLRMNFVQWVTVTVNSIAKNYIHKNLHALSPQFFFRYDLLSRNISNVDFLKKQNQNQKQTQKTKKQPKKVQKGTGLLESRAWVYYWSICIHC